MRHISIVSVAALISVFLFTGCNSQRTPPTPTITKTVTPAYTSTSRATSTNKPSLTPTPTFTPNVMTWRGLYKANFENSLFWPCDNPKWEIWWSAYGNIREIRKVTNNLDDFTPIYVEVTGEMHTISNGSYWTGIENQIDIKNILKVRKEIPEDCQAPSP